MADLIREVAANTAQTAALSTAVTIMDARQEERLKRLETLVASQHSSQGERMRGAESSITRLNLVVFGICGPVCLAALGAFLKVILE